MAIQTPITLSNINQQVGDVTQAAIQRNLQTLQAQQAGTPEVVPEKFTGGSDLLSQGLANIANALTGSDRREAQQRNADLKSQKEMEATAYARSQDQINNAYRQQQLADEREDRRLANNRADAAALRQQQQFDKQKADTMALEGYNAIINNYLVTGEGTPQEVGAELALYAKNHPSIDATYHTESLAKLKGAELAINQAWDSKQEEELAIAQSNAAKVKQQAEIEKESKLKIIEQDYPPVSNISSKKEAEEGMTISDAIATLRSKAPEDDAGFYEGKDSASGKNIDYYVTGDPNNPKDTGIVGNIRKDYEAKFKAAGVPYDVEWAFSSAANSFVPEGEESFFGADTRDVNVTKYENTIRGLIDDYLLDVSNRNIRLDKTQETISEYNKIVDAATQGYTNLVKSYTMDNLNKYTKAIEANQ